MTLPSPQKTLPLTREEALAADRASPFAAQRAAFSLPHGVIYLNGNSLGPPPKAALERLSDTAAREWGQGLARSWGNAGWMERPMQAGAKIARLLGVPEGTVLVCDSVSVNLFKLAAAAAKANPRARVLLIDGDEFPTDRYMMLGLAELAGLTVRSGDVGPDVAVQIKSAVHYKSGIVADMAGMEEAARAAGAFLIWDLSHAVGILPLDLARSGARLAVGCGYKYLNGGPGAPAFLYASADLAPSLRQPLSGWMGHATPFAFAPDYAPAEGVARFASGTPAILSLSALNAALDLYTDVSLKALHAQALALGDLFLRRLAPLGLEVYSPGIGEMRGAHAALRHPKASALIETLAAQGVIGDFRNPDLMRFGFHPFYVGYTDVWDAAERLGTILQSQ